MTTTDVAIRASWLDRASTGIEQTMKRAKQNFNAFKRAGVVGSNAISTALHGLLRRLTSIQGILATIGISLGFREATQEALEMRRALTGLDTIAQNYNVNQEKLRQGMMSLVADGFLSMSQAAQILRNLLSIQGETLEQAIEDTRLMTNVAVNFRKGQFSVGEAVRFSSAGLKEGISQIADTIGVTENLDSAGRAYIRSLGLQSSAIDENMRAYFNLRAFMQNAEKMQGDLTRQTTQDEIAMNKYAQSISFAKAALGELLIPAMLEFMGITKPVIDNVKAWAEANRELVGIKIQEYMERLLKVLGDLWTLFKALAEFASNNRNIIALILVGTAATGAAAIILGYAEAIMTLVVAVRALTVASIAFAATPIGLAILTGGAILAGLAVLTDRIRENTEAWNEYTSVQNKLRMDEAARQPMRFQSLPPGPDHMQAGNQAVKEIEDNLARLMAINQQLGQAADPFAGQGQAIEKAIELFDLSTKGFMESQKALSLLMRTGNIHQDQAEEVMTELVEKAKELHITYNQLTPELQNHVDNLMRQQEAQEEIGRELVERRRQVNAQITAQQEARETEVRDAQHLNDVEQRGLDWLTRQNQAYLSRLDNQKRSREEAERLLAIMNKESVKKVVLFFDADVTRVKTQSDLLVFSLGQLARALADVSPAIGQLLFLVEGVAKGAVIAGAKGGIAGGITGALSLAGSIFTTLSRESERAMQATQRYNEVLERQAVLQLELAGLAEDAIRLEIRQKQARLDTLTTIRDSILANEALRKNHEGTADFINLQADIVETQGEILKLEDQIVQKQRESRQEALNFLNASFDFLLFSAADQLATLRDAIPQFVGGDHDERVNLARAIFDRERQLRQEQLDLELQGINAAADAKITALRDASQRELDAINQRFDLERDLLASRLRSSFDIQAQALRLQFASQFGAARGNGALQDVIMGRFIRQADQLQRAQSSQLAVELARLQEVQEAQRASVEAQREARIAAVEASRAEQVEHFQNLMHEDLVEISRLLSESLNLGLLLPPPNVDLGPGPTDGRPVLTRPTGQPVQQVIIEEGAINISIPVEHGDVNEILQAISDPRIEEAITQKVRRAIHKAGGLTQFMRA